MVTSIFQIEISRLVSGSLAAAKIFYTGLAAFLVENARTRVNPTLSAKSLTAARLGAQGFAPRRT